jgi:antitoxin CcdA
MEIRTATRKRPVNLTLNEQLVAQARALTPNLSATVDSLLAAFVAEEHQRRRGRQDAANAACADWNALHARIGSFADEHSTL